MLNSTIPYHTMQGRAQNFSPGGATTEGLKAESGDGVPVERAATLPPARGPGECCELPQQGSGWSPDRPNVFHCFSALRMASPDNILLLMVDYHAAIGDKTPVPPLHTPCLLVVLVKLSVLAK